MFQGYNNMGYYPQRNNFYQPQVQGQPAQNNIQYVNGLESANAYQLAPNSSILLMDSNMARFYIKQTDASGYHTIKAYDFTEVTQDSQISANDEIKKLHDEIETIKAELAELKAVKTKGVTKNESTTK